MALHAALWKAKRLGKGSFGTVHKASAGLPASIVVTLGEDDGRSHERPSRQEPSGR